jgi:hypothetical protein
LAMIVGQHLLLNFCFDGHVICGGSEWCLGSALTCCMLMLVSSVVGPIAEIEIFVSHEVSSCFAADAMLLLGDIILVVLSYSCSVL